MKFLLINPTSPVWRVTTDKRPLRSTRVFRFSMLSSLYVAASVPSWVETTIVDEDVEPIDLDADADVVGLSFMTFNAPRAYELAGEFRRRGRTVIVGGYHPTLMPAEAAMHADAVCIGDAEPSVPRIFEDIANGELQQFYDNGPSDLRGLPVPDRRLTRGALYAPVTAVQATRGCPHKCTFCSVAVFCGHRFRMRPAEEVIAEIEPLGKRLLFMDDNITANPEYAKDLFAGMIPLGKRWFSQASLTIADDDELLDLAARSGCTGLFLGLESLSKANIDGWSKEVNRGRDYAEAIRRLHRAGIGVIAGIVFGSDDDTPAVFGETLEFLDRNNVDALQATILTPFPGTPLHDEMRVQGRLTDENWSHYDFRHVTFAPAHMTNDELRRGHDWVLSRFYSRRAVARRTTRAFSYLPASTVVGASLPLNVAYRARLRMDGTIQPGASASFM